MRTVAMRLSAVLVATGLLLAGANAGAQEKTIRFGFQNQADHPQGVGAQKFADLVAQKSGGKLVVKLFPGGVLGGDLQHVSALQGGTIDMTSLNAGLLSGNVKEFLIFDFPFLFENSKEADAVTDGPIGKKLYDLLPAKGLVGLAYWDNGFRNVTNSKRPIAKAEDIHGLKIRVLQSPIYIDLFNGLGANAVPMPFPELYSALEQKTVDGQENPARTIEASKLNEVQKFLTETRHTYNPMAVLISKKTWDRLSADERKTLQDAANESAVFQRQASRSENQKALDRMKQNGLQITQLSPEELAKMRDKAKPVTDKYSKQVGEALVSEVHAEIQKVRGKK